MRDRLFGLSLAMVACFSALPVEAQQLIAFRAQLSDSSMIPPTTSPGTAVVTIVGEPCPDPTVPPEVFVRFSDLIGEPVGLHIYERAEGEVGQLLYSVFDEGFVDGAYAYIEVDSIDCFFWTPFERDSAYCVITTDSFPGGEIRGQFLYWHPDPVIRSTWGRIKGLYMESTGVEEESQSNGAFNLSGLPCHAPGGATKVD